MPCPEGTEKLKGKRAVGFLGHSRAHVVPSLLGGAERAPGRKEGTLGATERAHSSVPFCLGPPKLPQYQEVSLEQSSSTLSATGAGVIRSHHTLGRYWHIREALKWNL